MKQNQSKKITPRKNNLKARWGMHCTKSLHKKLLRKGPDWARRVLEAAE